MPIGPSEDIEYPGQVDSISTKLRWVDMNANSGGVARATSIDQNWTNVFSYSGSGLFFGFVLTLESAENDWQLRLVVDSIDLLIDSTNGIHTEDIESNAVYGYNRDPARPEVLVLGIQFKDKTLRFQTPDPITYSSSVSVKVKRETTTTKKFLGGLVLLTKET